jgi:hypothetical protein
MVDVCVGGVERVESEDEERKKRSEIRGNRARFLLLLVGGSENVNEWGKGNRFYFLVCDFFGAQNCERGNSSTDFEHG